MDLIYFSATCVVQELAEGVPSSDGKKLYYLGIIDILTRWSNMKRIEHDLKAIKTWKGEGVSCIHPTTYAGECYLRNPLVDS